MLTPRNRDSSLESRIPELIVVRLDRNAKALHADMIKPIDYFRFHYTGRKVMDQYAV